MAISSSNRGPGLVPVLVLWFFLLAAAGSFFPLLSEARCRGGCDAVASYYVTENQNFTYIAQLFDISDYRVAGPYNKVTNLDSIQAGSRVNVPLRCDCINGEFLARNLSYTMLPGNTYLTVATDVYHNLTSVDWLRQMNIYPDTGIRDGVPINVVVNCSCGDAGVSKDYGFFVTYALLPGQTLASAGAEFGFTDSKLLEGYNLGVNSSAGSRLVYVPTKDPSGSYRPLKTSPGISGGTIAGISVAGVVVLVLIIYLSIRIYRRKKVKRATLLGPTTEDDSHLHELGPVTGLDQTNGMRPLTGASFPFTGLTVEKSVEFSYEELAKATDDFNMANKIGEGGFGAVYYAELRGEKAAIKKMDMQASKEFLAELNVLTHVHHLNLLRLIGYCIEGSLFLVYEYIENGNLNQHLHGGSGKEPLPWSVRVQIALDSARGLEYIHEHTVPVYIHRDIKSANILIDKNFRGKVADFGLTKLTEVGGASLQTRLVGTFGYMPPEYAQYGDVSPKIDVYAFGVVLYELISAKEAVVKTNSTETESRGLVALFESVLSRPDPREDLRKVVDPRLGDNYPIDSVYKVAQLARACTQENPQLRPSMRTIVVALMTLSSSTEYWDVGSFYDNQALVNLMSGR